MNDVINLNLDTQDLLSHLLNELPLALFIKTPSGEWLYANHQFKNLLSIDLESPLSTYNDLQIFGLECSEILAQAEGQLLRSKNKQQSKISFTDSKNQSRQLCIEMRLVKSSSETLILSVVNDITTLKHSDTLLEAKENKLRSLLELTQKIGKIGGWELSVIDNQVSWSDQVFEIHEIDNKTPPSLQEAISFYPGNAANEVKKNLANAINCKKSFDFVLPFITAKGNQRVVRSIGSPEVIDGKVQKIYGVFQDITDSISNERALAIGSERAELAIEGAELGTWDWNIIEGKMHCNKRFYSMLGYNLDELPNHIDQLFKLVHPLDQEALHTAIKKHFSAEDPHFAIEMRLRKKCGDYCWVLSKGSIIVRDQSGAALRMAGTHLDITDLKNTEEELKRQSTLLEAARSAALNAYNAKSQFLANMSHEIRTPLNGVIGMADLLKEAELDLEHKSYLKSLLDSGQLLLSIINDILDFSKIEAGKVRVIKEAFSPSELINSISNTFCILAEQKGISYVTSINGVMPDSILGDSLRIKQVLNNLLSNSLKFTPSGGAIVLSVDLTTNDTHCEMQFRVIDTGIGIQPEKQNKIFEAFEQANNGVAREFGGTGLGLTISRCILQMMNSDLQLRSKRRAGSVFYFTLNLELAEHKEQQIINQMLTTQLPEGLKIVVAEDNQINQQLIKVILEKQKADVTLVANGLELMKVLANDCFDLVLMDVQMPVMDGITATKKIREQAKYSKLPIIALTAHALDGDCDSMLKAGMNGYASKPIDKKHLFSEIARVCATNNYSSFHKSLPKDL